MMLIPPIQDQLTQGGQLTIWRIIFPMFVIVCLYPVFNVINAWYLTQIYPGEWLTDTTGYIYLGVNLIPAVATLGIGMSMLYWYFAATNQRKYQSQYQELVYGYQR